MATTHAQRAYHTVAHSTHFSSELPPSPTDVSESDDDYWDGTGDMDSSEIQPATHDSPHVHPKLEKLPFSLASGDIPTVQRADRFCQNGCRTAVYGERWRLLRGPGRSSQAQAPSRQILHPAHRTGVLTPRATKVSPLRCSRRSQRSKQTVSPLTSTILLTAHGILRHGQRPKLQLMRKNPGAPSKASEPPYAVSGPPFHSVRRHRYFRTAFTHKTQQTVHFGCHRSVY